MQVAEALLAGPDAEIIILAIARGEGLLVKWAHRAQRL
jgi:hypothetical protein